jgi:hypothetical protein
MSQDVVIADGSVMLLTGTPSQQRAYDAYQMRQRGTDWEQVCKTVGYSSVLVARNEVRAYLQEMVTKVDDVHREEVLQTELGRLDALQEACWDDAMSGDAKAIDSALKIINMRTKLLALDQLHADKAPTTNINTVVVTGDKEEFLARLELVNG